MNLKNRLEKLEMAKKYRTRPLFILQRMIPKELTDQELSAVILKCEPWEVNRELTSQELQAEARDGA